MLGAKSTTKSQLNPDSYEDVEKETHTQLIMEYFSTQYYDRYATVRVKCDGWNFWLFNWNNGEQKQQDNEVSNNGYGLYVCVQTSIEHQYKLVKRANL